MMTTNPSPAHFAIIDGKPYTAWTMADGHTMAGVYRCSSICFPASWVVYRVDGSECYVPHTDARPATLADVEAACRFYSTTPLGNFTPQQPAAYAFESDDCDCDDSHCETCNPSTDRPGATRYVMHWSDLDPIRKFATSRQRVAHMLLAARSRGARIERTSGAFGPYWYRIGDMCITPAIDREGL